MTVHEQAVLERDVGHFVARHRRRVLPPTVLVGTEITGLSVARALHRFGIPVLALDTQRRVFTGYSSALDVLVSPAVGSDELIGLLERIAALLPERAVLMMATDRHVERIGLHGQHLAGRYHVELPAPEAVRRLLFKQHFQAFATERGWLLPRAVVCRTAADVRNAAGTLRFPVIAKPAEKSDAFLAASDAKAFICHDAAELGAVHARIERWVPDLLVQEWVPGGDDAIHFAFHYFSRDQREIAVFEGRKIRQWPPGSGTTALASGVPRPLVAGQSRTILVESGCVGFGSVEFKFDARDGRYYIMEPTVGRVNLQVGTALVNGVNLIARGYFHLIGRPYPKQEQPTHHRRWVRFLADMGSARQARRNGLLSWPAYLRSLLPVRAWSVWDWRDLRLLGALVRFGPRILGSAIGRRLTRR